MKIVSKIISLFVFSLFLLVIEAFYLLVLLPDGFLNFLVAPVQNWLFGFGQSVFWLVLGILFLLFLIYLLLVIFWARNFSQQSKKLLEIAEKSCQIPGGSSSVDDMEKISLSFGELSNQLKRNKEALGEAKDTFEIKVKARTRELEEMARGLEGKVRERTKELQERIEELEKFHNLVVGRELEMIALKEKIKELEIKAKAISPGRFKKEETTQNYPKKLSMENQSPELQKNLEELVRQRTAILQARVNELEKFYNLAVGRELKMVGLKKDLALCQQELRGQSGLEEFRSQAKTVLNEDFDSKLKI